MLCIRACPTSQVPNNNEVDKRPVAQQGDACACKPPHTHKASLSGSTSRPQGHSSQGESRIDRVVTSCWVQQTGQRESNHHHNHCNQAESSRPCQHRPGAERGQQAATEHTKPTQSTAGKQPSAIKLHMQAMRGNTDTQRSCMGSRRRVGTARDKVRKA